MKPNGTEILVKCKISKTLFDDDGYIKYYVIPQSQVNSLLPREILISEDDIYEEKA